MAEITLNEIVLPPDLQWDDEFNWTEIRQTVKPSLTGAQLVQMNAVLAGRKITLSGKLNGQVAFATLQRTVVQALRTLEVSAMATPMTLTLSDGRVFSVIFRYDDGPAVEAGPLKFKDPPLPTDQYLVTIRLMTTA
jgi:hypothetical protein